MQTDTVISHGKISRAKRRLHLFAPSARFLPPVVLRPETYLPPTMEKVGGYGVGGWRWGVDKSDICALKRHIPQIRSTQGNLSLALIFFSVVSVIFSSNYL